MAGVRKKNLNKSPLNHAVIGMRNALGMTQPAFAHRIGVALPTIVRWETSSEPTLQGLTLLIESAIRHRAELESEASQPMEFQYPEGFPAEKQIRQLRFRSEDEYSEHVSDIKRRLEILAKCEFVFVAYRDAWANTDPKQELVAGMLAHCLEVDRTLRTIGNDIGNTPIETIVEIAEILPKLAKVITFIRAMSPELVAADETKFLEEVAG